MKQVTDPNLLKLLEGAGEPSPVDDPELLAQLETPAVSESQSDPELDRLKKQQRGRLAEQFYGGRDPNYLLTKTLAGAKHGFDRAALGAKGLFTDLSPEDQQLLAQGAAATEEGGAQGTIGQIGGEILATGGPAGLARRGATAVLPQALKRLSAPGAAGGVLGRVATPGAAAASGVEGATAAGLLAPGEGETRLGNAAVGAGLGAAIPGAAAAAGIPARWVAQEFLPTQGARQLRGAKTLERTLGPETTEQAVKAVANRNPSQLPLSTAAAAENPALARLERGSRNRASGWEWDDHDAKVYRQAWQQLQDATEQGLDHPALMEKASELMQVGKAKLDKMPLSQANSKKVVDGIADLKKSSEVISNPEINKELDNIIMSVTHPEARLGVLQEQYFRLRELAGQSTAAARARDLLRDVLDSRSKGSFSQMLDDYGQIQDKVKGAQAALDIQGKFMTPQGVPVTTRQFPSGRPDQGIPEIQAKTLRQTIAKEGEQGGVDVLGTRSRAELADLTGDLERHDLYRASQTPGSTALDPGAAMDVAATGRNNPIYTVPGLRGMVGRMFTGANKETERVLDNALRDPEAFMRMIEAKRALKRPLSEEEQLVRQVILSQARGLGAASVGEQNAP